MALTSTKKRREIGERLRTERERIGYTELQLASFLGVPEDEYLRFESGTADPGLFGLQKLTSLGFDPQFVITGERQKPVQEENELLARFRLLSLRGKNSVFMTLDALERLTPNIRQKIRDTFGHKS